jgi:hypothetical protein
VLRRYGRCARVRSVTVHRWLLGTLLCSLLVGSCGGPPAQSAGASARVPPAPSPGKRRTDIPDDCDVVAGQPPPEPLRIQYSGVAKAATCQRAVFTIMGGLTHFLGVECKHCHLEPDYAADTHNKQIANWMARELVPRLQKRAAADASQEVWCQDCHSGRPKLLGNPRRRDVAIEWMTTHLVEDFDSIAGKSLKCRDCHGGDLGTPEFRTKIILSEPLALPALVPPTPAALAPAEPTPHVPPIPDFGER